MNNLLEKKSLGNEILVELSKYAKIPNKGFLAGGAVANTIMRMCWGEEYPINDLDIFIEEDPRLVADFSVITTPIRSNSLNIEGDGYMVTKMAYDHNTTYQITKVERDGFLNTITIRKTFVGYPVPDYEYVLNGFDFNCCQVGIDLSNNKLIYSEGFKDFLTTKQLEITAIYTPSHTAIRLFKKIDELKCYCDVESCMELLSQPLIPENITIMTRGSFGIYFGEKYKEMFNKYYSRIKEYFSIVRFFEHKKEIYNYRHNPTDVVISDQVKWLDPKYSIPKELLEKWAKYNDVIWTLTPKKYNKRNETIFRVLESVSFNPLTFMEAYSLTKKSISKKQRAKAELILNNGYFSKMLCLTNKGFYDCDFDLSHITYLENMLNSERWLMKIIFGFKMNIQESYNLVKNIKKIFNSEGEWVSPLLQRSLFEGNIIFKPTYESMMSELQAEKEKYSANIIEPLNIDGLGLPEEVKIKELTSELDLKWAGTKLKNCINNPGQHYKDKIEKGSTKIFVIITPKNMSAIELMLAKDGLSYNIVQILSYCNKETSEYHKTLGNILTNHLNKIKFTDGYQARLKSFGDIERLNRSLLIALNDESTDNNITPLFPLAVPDANEIVGQLNLFANNVVYEDEAPIMVEELTEEQDMVEELTEEQGPMAEELPTLNLRLVNHTTQLRERIINDRPDAEDRLW